jgi:hypothetical protein
MRVFVEIPSALRRHWRTAAMLLMCAVGGWAQAQAVTSGDAADPPSRVARLSYLTGDVGFLPSGASTWSDANLNRPLTTGDRLSTGADARAELEFGGSNLRMDSGTDFGLLDLGDQVAQIELTQGTLGLSVRDLGDGQSVEIDTPTVALVVDRPGAFRVDVGDGARGTQISVLDGSAVVYGENNAQRNLVAGRSYRFDDSALGSVVISDLGGGDAFDAWGRDRDQRYARSESRQYVSDEMIGYQDLDQYGDWQTDSDYGAVWYPTQVSSTWAPYSFGHWAYIAPWGWSWIDDAAWGFAPYHYGRWANLRGRWGWIPGPLGVRPIYAPALVAFVGGGGWSVGIGSGPVGWFPLGPGEIYNPWYRASRAYYTNVNITNIYVRRGHDRRRFQRDIGNHYNHYRRGERVHGERYANRHAPRGFTTVSGRTFASGQAVRGGADRVEQRALAGAAVLPRGVGARPVAGRTALPRSAHTRALPVGGFERQVVARRAPPAARTTPADVAVRTARDGGRRPVATPSRVRVLAQGAQGGRQAPSDVSRRPVAAPAEVNRVGADRVDVRRGVQERVDTAQDIATRRSANRDLVHNRAAAVRPLPAADRASPQRAGVPLAAGAAAVGQPERTLPDVAPIRRADQRPGALPSARFARPERRMSAPAEDDTPRSFGGRNGAADDSVRAAADGSSPRNQRDGSPRPGLSIISADNAARAARSADNRPASAPPLPQVPRFERRTADSADRAPVERRAAMQRMVPANEPAMPQRQLPARIERPEPARAAPRQASRAMAPRPMEAAPPRQYQPRQELPRAPMSSPPPRMVAPPAARNRDVAPARNEGKARPAPRSKDHSRRDDQRN